MVNDNTSPITENTTNPNDTITFKIPALTLGTRVSVSVSAYTSVGQGSPVNLTNLVTLTETREFMLKIHEHQFWYKICINHTLKPCPSKFPVSN